MRADEPEVVERALSRRAFLAAAATDLDNRAAISHVVKSLIYAS